MNKLQNTNHHILSSSANLLGVCFVIFTFVIKSGKSAETSLDELAMLGVFIFLTACIFSYLSLRTEVRNLLLERIADTIFICGLILLAVTSVVVTFEIH